ncbi:MAG: GNAT family N-acetyltransferase [Coriobacteriia bacterium]
MRRLLKPFDPSEAAGLPAVCAGCAFWESDVVRPVRCGATCDEALVAERVRAVHEEWGEMGRAAWEDGELLGFVKYAPARFFPQSALLPAGPPSEDAVLLACLHITPEARRHGLGKLLLQAAMRDAVSHGAKALEAFAAARRIDYETSPVVGMEFLLRHGFTVRRPHPEYPLLRLETRSLAVWREDLESMLESLRFPLRVPARVPSTNMRERG